MLRSRLLLLCQSIYFCSFLSPLTLYTFLSSSQQRHSSGSALPLHLLPGGGANGQQGRQQHPRFLKKQLSFFVNFPLSVVVAVTSPEQQLLAQRRSLQPLSSLLRALPSPSIGLSFNQIGFKQVFFFRSRHNSAQGRLCRSR